MKKLALKFLAVFALVFGVISLGGTSTFAQNTFGDTSQAGGINLGAGGTTAAAPNLIAVIRTFINWMLGILSLIALIILLYGGFNMITAAGDDTKYKSGFKILQQAAVGLVFVGVSWIIVTTIFWFLGQMGV